MTFSETVLHNGKIELIFKEGLAITLRDYELDGSFLPLEGEIRSLWAQSITIPKTPLESSEQVNVHFGGPVL